MNRRCNTRQLSEKPGPAQSVIGYTPRSEEGTRYRYIAKTGFSSGRNAKAGYRTGEGPDDWVDTYYIQVHNQSEVGTGTNTVSVRQPGSPNCCRTPRQTGTRHIMKGDGT